MTEQQRQPIARFAGRLQPALAIGAALPICGWPGLRTNPRGFMAA